jgi:hypothetical protein
MSQDSENNMCGCGWELVEDDMEHLDDWFKPRCWSCRDELAEAGVEPGEDEDVESVCCLDCEESFKIDEPVDCLDYHAGRHEMRCSGCRSKCKKSEEVHTCDECEEPSTHAMGNGEYHYCDTHYKPGGACDECGIELHQNWDCGFSDSGLLCRPCHKNH